MSTTLRIVFLALFLLSPGLLQAKEKAVAVLDAGTKTQFDDQAAAIRAQMAAGGRFEFVKPEERTVIELRLVQMERLLAETANASDLGDRQKVDLMVAQEDINAILTMRDGKRLICEQVSPTGTHRKIKQCGTYADRERARIEAQKYLRETNRKSISRNE